jgi:hypothetical protein
MADAFHDRETAAEARWIHDEEWHFKVMVRRNKLLGLWAAGEMGLAAGDADAYAKEVVQSDFQETGDHDVFRKVRSDLDAKGVDVSDHLIRVRMDELLATAEEQMRAEAAGNVA